MAESWYKISLDVLERRHQTLRQHFCKIGRLCRQIDFEAQL